MQTPTGVQQEAVRLRERWAIPRVATTLVIVVVAIMVPGASAVALRPDNPGEGYIALLLGAVVVAWQLRRLATAGLELSPEGLRRLNSTVTLPWQQVEVFWQTSHYPEQKGHEQNVHRLRARLSSGEEVDLTRYPAKDAQADRFTTALRDVGLFVPTPDWSTVERPR